MDERQRAPRSIAQSPFWPQNYHVGMWAFVLHRFTGLILVGYVFLHIWVISSVTVSGGTFDEAMRVFQTPLFIFLDVGLLAAFLFHMLNGLRILLFDLRIGVNQQKPLFWGAFIISALITVYALVEAQPYIFGKPLT